MRRRTDPAGGTRETGGTPVTVSGWIGSANAGDELVHAGLRRLLGARTGAVAAISVDPSRTVVRHGGGAVRRSRAVAEIAAGRRRGALVLGGGGLLQDETSAANLPYHLTPLVVARARGLAVAGIGLGAGPITTRAGRRLVVGALAGLDLTVRDEPSASVLQGMGLARPVIGADLALELAAPTVDVDDDVLAVALRPWEGRRHRLPVGLRPGARGPDDAHVDRVTAAVDAVAARLHLRVRFVAFDAGKDDALHHAVAERLRAEVVDVVAPEPVAAVAAVAGARMVVAMRYHAGIAALLGRRPAVLLGYGPKVDALAADVGAGVVATPWGVGDPGAVAAAAARAMAEAGDGVLDEALARLRTRGAANGVLLDRVLDRVRDRPD